MLRQARIDHPPAFVAKQVGERADQEGVNLGAEVVADQEGGENRQD